MRGFSLVEMMVVVAVLGVVSAIAMPDMTPVVRRTELRGALGDTVSVVERARREARASGRCARVELTSGALVLSRATDAQCTTWQVLTTVRPPADVTASFEGNAPNVMFLGNGRLAGDQDLDLEDDGARIALRSRALTMSVYYAGVTSSGLVCSRQVTTLPPFDAGAVCFSNLSGAANGFRGDADTETTDIAAGYGSAPPPAPPPPGDVVNEPVSDPLPPPPEEDPIAEAIEMTVEAVEEAPLMLRSASYEIESEVSFSRSLSMSSLSGSGESA